MNILEDQNKGQRLCVICGERKIYYNFSINQFRIEKCSNCTLMRINPQPTQQELTTLNDNIRDDAFYFSEHYLDQLESYAGTTLKGNLLYIGSLSEDFKKRAMTKSLLVTEVKMIDDEKLSIVDPKELFESKINSLLASKECFDYIFIVNILHRVHNPRTFLKNIRNLLKENGIIVSVLPSLDSLTARLMKSRWSGFNPKNFWYFSKHTLSRLFYDESFDQIKTDAIKQSVNIDYLPHHFSEYPKPFLTLIKCFKLLPKFLRKHTFGLATSNIILFAKSKPVHSPKKLSVIMPAFNEATSIQKAIDKVLAKKIDNVEIELIIVESNSKDGTREIVKQYEGKERVTVIWQDTPQGKGNAVRVGLTQVTGDYILIQDADDEYDIEDYDGLIEPLITGEATFVLGARHGGGAWKMRQFDDQKLTGHLLNLGHWIFTALVNITYGLKLKDPFTMYKVFRADCLHGITLECNRFDFDYELLIKLVKNGHCPIEIPVNYRSRSFKEGKKVNVLRDPWTWLFAIVKYKFS